MSDRVFVSGIQIYGSQYEYSWTWFNSSTGFVTWDNPLNTFVYSDTALSLKAQIIADLIVVTGKLSLDVQFL